MKRLALDENKSLVVGDGERASFSLDLRGSSPLPAGGRSNMEWRLGRGAEVYLIQVLRNEASAELWVNHRFFLKEGSKLSVVTISLGGGVTHSHFWVEFEEAHAEASIQALSVLGGQSQIFHRVVMNHAKPFCTSRQVFKNILLGRSRSEFDSLVHVLPEAQKSDTRQLNKNLLLSDDALAFSRPQLQIDADDVSCTHGATVGRLEKDELFYLRSRGLSEGEARFVLIDGFAQEIIQEIREPALRSELESLMGRELRRMTGEQGEKC